MKQRFIQMPALLARVHTLQMLAWPALLAGALLIVGCKGGSQSGKEQEEQSEKLAQKPQSKGLPYELVLVIPRGIYTGELKDTLDAVLQGSTPVLPQHEAMFRLDVAYTDANLTPWRTFRNRMVVEVDSRQKKAQLGVAMDAAARPQIEVKVTASTPHELAEFLGAQRQRLTDLFVDHELECEAANLRRKNNRMTRDSLFALCAHTICVPPAFRAAKVGENFLWTGTNLNDKDQNFIYYSYAWNGRPLSPEQFVEKHDSVLRVNIPGARAGQWMQTARVHPSQESAASALSQSDTSAAPAASGHPASASAVLPPLILARTRVIHNNVVQQVHGLWELKDGALGGPFVALERVDTAAGRVLVCEGFIYSPHSPKRDLLRQMEAALRTFE